MTPWETGDWFVFALVVVALELVVGLPVAILAVLVWGVTKAIRTAPR